VTAIEDFARFVSGLTLDRIPPRVVEKARLQQASVVAAGLSSRIESAAVKVAAASASRGEAGPVRLLAGPGTTSLHSAVFANAAATCSSDFDEILLLGHVGHSSVNVPFALADARPELTYGRVLAAQVAANEIGGRLGLSTFFGPGNGQNLPQLHTASAAAAASVMLGLPAEETAHAMAIALSQPPAPMWPAFLGEIESKVLVAARPTEAGLAAAELAAQGLRGPLDLLDHPRGLYARFAWLPVRRALGGLGRAWLTDTLEVKTHAACWYFQALLDAAADILRQAGRSSLGAKEVRRIRCRTTLLSTSVDALARSLQGDRVTANTMNFRLDRSLALFLLAGRLTPVELEEHALHERVAEMRDLASKVKIEHDIRESRRTVATIDAALDLGGLLGDTSPARIFRALRQARSEYPGMPGPRLAELPGLLRAAGTSIRVLAKGRRKPYDLGDRGESIASLAPACGGTVELELEDGRRFESNRGVPAGALHDPSIAGPLVRAKLRLALDIAKSGGDADRALAIRPEEPGHRFVDAVLP